MGKELSTILEKKKKKKQTLTIPEVIFSKQYTNDIAARVKDDSLTINQKQELILSNADDFLSADWMKPYVQELVIYLKYMLQLDVNEDIDDACHQMSMSKLMENGYSIDIESVSDTIYLLKIKRWEWNKEIEIVEAYFNNWKQDRICVDADPNGMVFEESRLVVDEVKLPYDHGFFDITSLSLIKDFIRSHVSFYDNSNEYTRILKPVDTVSLSFELPSFDNIKHKVYLERPKDFTGSQYSNIWLFVKEGHDIRLLIINTSRVSYPHSLIESDEDNQWNIDLDNSSNRLGVYFKPLFFLKDIHKMEDYKVLVDSLTTPMIYEFLLTPLSEAMSIEKIILSIFAVAAEESKETYSQHLHKDIDKFIEVLKNHIGSTKNYISTILNVEISKTDNNTNCEFYISDTVSLYRTAFYGELSNSWMHFRPRLTISSRNNVIRSTQLAISHEVDIYQ